MYKIHKDINPNIDEDTYVIDLETEGIQGTTSLKASKHNFKVSLDEFKKVNSDLINYISSHQDELLAKYKEIYSIEI